jgi:Streptomycin adenylyltransferase
MLLPDEADVLATLVAWGEARASIRAMILTSTRAPPEGRADLVSDYDVILAVRDAPALAVTASWISGYGQPLVRWGDEHELYGIRTYFRGVVRPGGLHAAAGVPPPAGLGDG